MTANPEAEAPASAATAELRIGDRVLDLPIQTATEGQPAFNIGSLLKEAGVTTLDYGFANTAATRSAITYLDGDKGILRYRGYPIEQLAERSTFLETAYLLIYGELPTAAQLDDVDDAITRHTLLHEEFRRFFDGFPMDAHPMGILASAVAALSTFYQTSEDPQRPRRRRDQHDPADRQDADDRRVSPTRSRSASRSSTRTTASTTRATSCG